MTLDPANVPPVADEEMLARFVLASSHFRRSDNTVKPEAFMPHPRVELSLTRHLQMTEEEIWREGQRVSQLRVLTLYGRADVPASTFNLAALKVVAAPILPENPNHADATGWPAEKSAQKIKALEIAKIAIFITRST